MNWLPKQYSPYISKLEQTTPYQQKAFAWSWQQLCKAEGFSLGWGIVLGVEPVGKLSLNTNWGWFKNQKARESHRKRSAEVGGRFSSLW